MQAEGRRFESARLQVSLGVHMPSSDLNARMYFDQGRQSFSGRDFESACDQFKRAVDCDPMYHEAHRYLAESFEKLGYRNRARKAWEALLRITRDDSQLSDIRQRLQSLQ